MNFIKLQKTFCNIYKVQFIGKKEDLVNFLEVVMGYENIYYDLNFKFWVIHPFYLNHFLAQYQHLGIEVINKIPRIKRYDKELDGIGLSMKLQPYIYQKESINFILKQNNALLILPCGAGKTPTGIGAYLESKERGIISGKGLVVVKASLKYQWVAEIGKFSDLKAVAIESPSSISTYIKGKINKNKKKMKALDKIKDHEEYEKLKALNDELEKQVLDKFKAQFEGNDIYVVNYEALIDDTIRNEIHKMDIDFIFGDEIHMIGSRDSLRSKALHELQATVKVGATATPITNNPSNIYSIFKFIQPDLFPSWNKFSGEFIKWVGRGRVGGVKNGSKLTNMIAPYIMIKSKEEISDQLPSLRVIQRYVTLTDKQYAMNNTIMEELEVLKEQDFQIRSRCKTDYEANNNPELQKLGAQILALQTFAQEIANAPRLLEDSDSDFAKKYVVKQKENPKLEMFMDIVSEIIESGEKVAVFSRFERMQSIITERIHKYDKNIGIAYVSGSISGQQRFDEVYNKFTNNDTYKVLLLSDAGAEGINLGKCKYLIEYDIANSYAIQTQRHGRLERADSIHDNVIVYQLIAKDSFDEISLKIVGKKENYDLELIKSIAH